MPSTPKRLQERNNEVLVGNKLSYYKLNTCGSSKNDSKLSFLLEGWLWEFEILGMCGKMSWEEKSQKEPPQKLTEKNTNC